jgi:hypothetical protein
MRSLAEHRVNSRIDEVSTPDAAVMGVGQALPPAGAVALGRDHDPGVEAARHRATITWSALSSLAPSSWVVSLRRGAPEGYGRTILTVG